MTTPHSELSRTRGQVGAELKGREAMVSPPAESEKSGPDSAEQIRFEGKLTTQDYIDAFKLHYRPPRPALTLSVLSVMAALLLFPALGVPVLLGSGFASFYIAFPVLGFMTLWGFLVWWSFRTAARRQLASSPFHQDSQEGTITPLDVEIRGSEWVTRYSWQMVFKTKSSDRLILLYQMARGFYIFPRRFFSSQRDWEVFRQWAGSHKTTPFSIQDRKAGRLHFLVVLAVIVALAVLFAALRYHLRHLG